MSDCAKNIFKMCRLIVIILHILMPGLYFLSKKITLFHKIFLALKPYYIL